MVKKKLKKKGGGHGVSAQELREREKLRRANAQADEERARPDLLVCRASQARRRAACHVASQAFARHRVATVCARSAVL